MKPGRRKRKRRALEAARARWTPLVVWADAADAYLRAGLLELRQAGEAPWVYRVTPDGGLERIEPDSLPT